MTALTTKVLLAAAIIGGSLFAANGAAFAAGSLPQNTEVQGTGSAPDRDTARGNAVLNAASQCASGQVKGVDNNGTPLAITFNKISTGWAVLVKFECA
jgi:hypothetical protein